MSPLAKSLFEIASIPQPDEYRFGYMTVFSNKPVTMPTIKAEDAFEEAQRQEKILRHEFRGRPGEL